MIVQCYYPGGRSCFCVAVRSRSVATGVTGAAQTVHAWLPPRSQHKHAFSHRYTENQQPASTPLDTGMFPAQFSSLKFYLDTFSLNVCLFCHLLILAHHGLPFSTLLSLQTILAEVGFAVNSWCCLHRYLLSDGIKRSEHRAASRHSHLCHQQLMKSSSLARVFDSSAGQTFLMI